jgi:cytochrome c biogenesis protein CcdA/thiol-disulfide isomerase/thioredoxin
MIRYVHRLWLLPLILILGLLGVSATSAAPISQGEVETPVYVYFFWGEGCPHCMEAKSFLEDLERRYTRVEVVSFEVYHNPENQVLFSDMAAAHGFEARYVPTIFVGDQHWDGFANQLRGEIEAAVRACVEGDCPDAGEGIVSGHEPVTDPTVAVEECGVEADVCTDPSEDDAEISDEETITTPVETEAATPVPTPVSSDDAGDGPSSPPDEVLRLPLLGSINLGQQSLWVSTALISFVDGFNPCSLWVLSILISLTLRTGSRKKVFLTGFVFLTITSFIYVLFIAGLFTIFTFIGFLGWIQAVVAVLALLFAAVNIKDYFWYKEGISFTIADEKKPGIYKGMRKIVYADSLWGMLAATVVMSAGIAIVEMPCTAGFPVIWTNLLAGQGVDQVTFILLLGLYMLIYLLDELFLFMIAVVTLKSSKLEEKHGRVLKLIGGMLMLLLAAVMLIDPALMNELGTSLMIFVGALVAALLVLVVHRHLLPKLGVYIGTELTPSED